MNDPARPMSGGGETLAEQARALVRSSPSGRAVVRLAAAVDAARTVAPAVAVLGHQGPIAVDTPTAIGAVPGPVLDLPRHVAMPPLVNAHAHLDLTGVGEVPFNGVFADWAGQVRSRRAQTPEAVAAAVHEGVRRSVAGGTGFIGDIAGNFGLAALESLRSCAEHEGLAGVGFVEVFGIGKGSARGVEFLKGLRESVVAERGGIRLGVSPHAPYSCDDAVYAAAAELGLPLATHLAETLDELQFVRDGSGPFRELLKSVGAWTPELAGWGHGPVERLQEVLQGTGALLVHLNYLDQVEFDRLVQRVTKGRGSVAVYCPRASAFFRHPAKGRPAHRYRDMLAAGLPVALGTDSAIVLGDAPTISVLDEMRLLHRRDATPAATLVAMATVHGAAALGVDPSLVQLPSGARRGAARLLAVPVSAAAAEPVTGMLESDRPCEWLWR